VRVEHEAFEVAPRIDPLLVDGGHGASDAVEDAEVAVERGALLIEVPDADAAPDADAEADAVAEAAGAVPFSSGNTGLTPPRK